MKKKHFMWTMRDGSKIPVTEMTDSHLLNAISFCERHEEAYRNHAISEGYSMLSGIQGEQATYDIENEISRLEEGEFDLYDESKSYRALVDEKERREL